MKTDPPESRRTAPEHPIRPTWRVRRRRAHHIALEGRLSDSIRAAPVLIFILMALALTAVLPPAVEAQEHVRIYRDGWGVPHVHAASSAGAAYGLGYAQAEDRIEACLKNYLAAVGRMAEFFGPEFLGEDLQTRLWLHAKAAREGVDRLPEELKAFIVGFTAGLNAYILENPEKSPDWAFHIEPYHVLALGRYLAFRDLISQADRDYAREAAGPAHTGNQWVVSRNRSAEDAVVLCADPFEEWSGPLRLYEMHVHGGDLHACGFTRPGLPVILYGHNLNLAWSALSGGPDGADVYEIDLETHPAERYAHEGAWRPVITDSLHIAIREDGRQSTRSLPVQRTHLGPLMHRENRLAFAYRLSLETECRQIEQLYRQMAAEDLRAFYSALELLQFGPQRILYGDAYGNVAYILSGRTPVRSELHLWSLPVSGNSEGAGWDGIHPLDDLPQIHNPESGWIQDCDARMDRLTPFSPLTPDSFPDYFLDRTALHDAPRSRRATALLSSLTRIDREEALSLAQDNYVIDSRHWIHALNVAAGRAGRAFEEKTPGLEEALQILNGWNGFAEPDQTGITLYATWREACRQGGRTMDADAVRTHRPLDDSTQAALLDAMVETIATLKGRYGRLRVYWKEVHRFRRFGASWSLPGISEAGLDCIRSSRTVRNGPLADGSSGQAGTFLVFLTGPGRVQSFSAVPFGQSDHVDSPHAVDQAESLYSRNRLKLTGFGPTPTPDLALQFDRTVSLP